MFDSNWDFSHAMWTVVVAVTIAAIATLMIRAFRSQDKRPWPTLLVGAYDILLLLSVLFGIATQVRSEGFGFVPLLVLTMPWSWLAGWVVKSTGAWDSSFLTGNFAGLLFINSTIFVLPGAVNSWILYVLLKRHQRKVAEDEAWEQARRNR